MVDEHYNEGMPITPKEEKQFLEILTEKKRLSLAESVAVFRNRNGALNAEDVCIALRGLWTENLFEIVHLESGEAVFIKEHLFEALDSYEIRLIGFEGKENNLAKIRIGRILSLDIPFLRKRDISVVDVQAPGGLRICGDRDGALLLAERLRSFTHRFGIDLVSGNQELVKAAFSGQISSKYSAEALLDKIARIEKEFGRFAYFDYVEVITVYNGQHAHIDTEASIPVPRGMDQSARRGQSRLSLVSVWTPNGVAIYEYLLDLFVIEEAGVFRLSGFRLSSGY